MNDIPAIIGTIGAACAGRLDRTWNAVLRTVVTGLQFFHFSVAAGAGAAGRYYRRSGPELRVRACLYARLTGKRARLVGFALLAHFRLHYSVAAVSAETGAIPVTGK